MQTAKPSHAIGQAMNHDRPAWIVATRLAPGTIFPGWIGDMQRQVIGAARVSSVNDIVAFRRPVVAFADFGPGGCSSKGDPVGAQRNPVLVDGELSSAFLDNDEVSSRALGKRVFQVRCGPWRCGGQASRSQEQPMGFPGFQNSLTSYNR